MSDETTVATIYSRTIESQNVLESNATVNNTMLQRFNHLHFIQENESYMTHQYIFA